MPPKIALRSPDMARFGFDSKNDANQFCVGYDRCIEETLPLRGPGYRKFASERDLDLSSYFNLIIWLPQIYSDIDVGKF